MEEKETRTSTKQRIIIIVIAVLMLGSFIAVYVGIVMGQGNKQSGPVDQEKTAELQQKYVDKNKEVEAEAAKWSAKYLEDLKQYKANVKSFNSANANSDGLKTNDIKTGTGAEITQDNPNYFAYYIGWCADESVFDSSFDSYEKPTALKTPVDALSTPLIEGWSRGVAGMKIGGVRELSIPGELAYGNSKEICGGKNSPLHFVVMALERTDPLAKLSTELANIQTEYMKAYYGTK